MNNLTLRLGKISFSNLKTAFDIKVTLEELKVWLKQAIIDLCSVFKKILPKGMPPDLAQARVVMLEKTSRPRGIQDGRPITFFSVLSRLSSKLIVPCYPRKFLVGWWPGELMIYPCRSISKDKKEFPHEVN